MFEKVKEETKDIQITRRGKKIDFNNWLDSEIGASSFSEYNFIYNLANSKNAEDAINKSDFFKDKEDKDLDVISDIIMILNKYWNEIRKVTKEYLKIKEGMRTWAMDKFKKDAEEHGFTVESFKAALSWIHYYTRKSRREIPEDAKRALKALTVVESTLPKVVYRGLFLDGAKIKNKEEFLKTLESGETPKELIKRGASSWSASKETAIHFMNDQDFIKDQVNGFHILLEWEVDPKYVIADLRNLKKYNDFWNQQEIIANPPRKDYKVIKYIKYHKGYENGKRVETPYEKFRRENTFKIGSGEMSIDVKKLILDIFNLYRLDIPEDEKIRWKEYTYMTIPEIEKVERFSLRPIWKIKNDVENNNILPIVSFIRCINIEMFDPYVYPIRSINKESAEVKFSISNGDFLSDFYDKLGKENLIKLEKNSRLIPRGAMFNGNGKIKILQNNILKFQFEIELPKEYKWDIYGEYDIVKVKYDQKEILNKIEKDINDNIFIINDMIEDTIFNDIEKKYRNVKIKFKE